MNPELFKRLPRAFAIGVPLEVVLFGLTLVQGVPSTPPAHLLSRLVIATQLFGLRLVDRLGVCCGIPAPGQPPLHTVSSGFILAGVLNAIGVSVVVFVILNLLSLREINAQTVGTNPPAPGA